MMTSRLHFMATTFLLGLTQVAWCWESDVHYGLTRWLARQAGFGFQQAETIAQGNWESDLGLTDPRYLVFFYACLPFRDPNASGLVRDLHFPTFESVPNPSRRRHIEAGGRAAHHSIEKELSSKPAPSASPQELARRLYDFGKALHPLQDSWSHQGVPDIPGVCDDDLGWGHPAGRGGWFQHVADHSHRWLSDAILTAKITYELLIKYLQGNPWVRETSSKSWSEIEKDVDGFARASTKTDKRAWFKARGFVDFGFLDELTVPDGKDRFSLAAIFKRKPAGFIPPGTLKFNVPREVIEFFNRFFERWLLGSNAMGFLSAYVDPKAVAGSMAVGKELSQDPRLLATTALWMWRVQDHGLVTSLGHSIGTGGQANFHKLVKLTDNQDAYIKFRSVNEALWPFGRDSPVPFITVPSSKETERSYTAIARLRHAPRDTVAITAERVEGRWRAVSVSWSIDH